MSAGWSDWLLAYPENFVLFRIRKHQSTGVKLSIHTTFRKRSTGLKLDAASALLVYIDIFNFLMYGLIVYKLQRRLRLIKYVCFNDCWKRGWCQQFNICWRNIRWCIALSKCGPAIMVNHFEMDTQWSRKRRVQMDWWNMASHVFWFGICRKLNWNAFRITQVAQVRITPTCNLCPMELA